MNRLEKLLKALKRLLQKGKWGDVETFARQIRDEEKRQDRRVFMVFDLGDEG